MDVVIVGGGLGGCTLGAALAEAGLEVEVLERTTTFEDRVRGEWMAPWGVAEAKRLGVYETLLAIGGHHLSRHIGYDEAIPPDAAEAAMLPIAELHPEVPGPLCLEHVRMQNALLERALAAGVTVRRGVREVQIEPGEEPGVRFRHQGRSWERTCRLLVGADGRASVVRRQAGLELVEDPVDHLIAGLLVENAPGWPEDLQAIGKAGDVQYLVFPQGGGKIRMYADFDLDQRARFSGPDAARRFLDAFDIDFLPSSRALVDSTPIGPCRSYPSQSAAVDDPRADGIVLMGDAAGFNDPILGQGLSVTLRDARFLRDLLTSGDRWQRSLFDPWVEERRERMRRLRFVADFVTRLFARFDAESVERRERALMRMNEDQTLWNLAFTSYLGPEAMPPELFTPAFRERVFGD